MRVFLSVSGKGGVGKTTLAFHAAKFFAETFRVLAVDLDHQGNLSSALDGPAPPRGLFDAITLFGTEHDHFVSGLDEPGIVVARAERGDTRLPEVERRAPGEVLTNFLASMQALSGGYDVCVIDTPPALHLRVAAALMAADYIISPVELGEWSMDGLESLMGAIEDVRQAGRDPVFLGLLISRFDARTQGKTAAELIESVGGIVFPGAVRNRDAFRKSANTKQPVWEMSGSSARTAAAEIRDVLSQIEKRMELKP